jgi:PAS domain S-box-containing protein
MKQKLPSIRHRFVTIFSILLIFVSAVGLYASYRISRDFREDISRRSLAHARSISDRIEVFLNAHLHVFSETKISLENTPYDAENTQEEMVKLLRHHPIFESLMVLDELGVVMNTVPHNDDYIGIDFSRQQFFQDAVNLPFNEFFWSDSFISIQTGHPSVIISLPFSRGVIMANINLNTLSEITQIPTSRDEGFVILTDRKGFIIAHPDHQLVQQRHNVSSIESVRMGLGGMMGSREDRWMGQKGLISFHPVQDSGWLVLFFQTDKTAFGIVNKVYRAVQLVILLSFLLALLTFYHVQKRGQSSHKILESQVKLIAAGMDGHTLESEYREYTGIMDSINEMSRTIRSKEAYLKASEEQFKSLFDHAADAIMIVSTQGRIVEVNRIACEMHGYTTQEMSELHIWDVESRLSEKEIRESWSRISEGTPVTVTSIHRRKDGTEFPVEKRLTRILIKNTPFYLGFVRDITDRIETEAELRESEERYRLLAENVGDVIWTMDLDLQRTYVSPSIQWSRGFTQEESLKRSLLEDMTPDSYSLVQRILGEELEVEREGTGDSRRARNVELEFYTKDGSTIWGEVTVSFMRDDEGKATGIIGVTRDITQRKDAEQKLRETEERFRKAFMTGPLPIFITRLSDGRIVDINETFQLEGYTRDEIIGKTTEELLFWSQGDRDRFLKILETEGRVENYEHEAILRDGSKRQVLISSVTINLDNEPHLLTVVHDITELKATEQALRESEQRLRTISEAVLEGIVVTEKGVVSDANEQIAWILGFEKEEIIGQEVMDFVAPGSRELVMENIKKNITGSYEHMALRKNGSEVPVMVTGVESVYQGRPARITSIMDMTEIKRAEAVLREREKRYYLLYEDNPLPYQSLDEEGRILEVNTAWEQMLGYWRGDVIGTDFLSMILEGYRDEIQQCMAEKAKNEEVLHLEFELTRKDGTSVPVSVYSRFAVDEETKKLRRHCILIDITKRKQVEEDIKNELKVKEFLLKEIHHRVKNNLQAISSILEIQSNMIEDQRANKALRDSQDRILSMSLIHEKLYQMGDLHEIDLGDYISGLVNHLAVSHSVSDDRIKISVSCERIPTNAETALPCGLIVTELVSNSFKHAFPNGRSGHVSVDLKHDEKGHIVILQRDDGIGIPRDFDVKGSASLGLSLVKSYVEHLSGSIEVLRGKGTGYRITLQEYEECPVEEL